MVSSRLPLGPTSCRCLTQFFPSLATSLRIVSASRKGSSRSVPIHFHTSPSPTRSLSSTINSDLSHVCQHSRHLTFDPYLRRYFASRVWKRKRVSHSWEPQIVVHIKTAANGSPTRHRQTTRREDLPFPTRHRYFIPTPPHPPEHLLRRR